MSCFFDAELHDEQDKCVHCGIAARAARQLGLARNISLELAVWGQCFFFGGGGCVTGVGGGSSNYESGLVDAEHETHFRGGLFAGKSSPKAL